MSNYAAPIEVLQAAASRIGEMIVSLSDGSAPAQIANANYEGIVRKTLAYRGHGWTFATDTFDATPQGAITSGPWTFAYTIPAAVLKVRNVMVSGCRLRRDDYTIQKGRLLTRVEHAAGLQVTALFRAGENEWSDDFADVVVTRLEALFLRGLLERAQDARIRDKDADEALLLALVSDKRQQPVESVEANPLAEAWRGARGRRA